MLAPLAFLPQEPKPMDPLLTQSLWIGCLFLACYALVGLALFGNWEEYGFFGKTLYFLIFPMHTVGLGIVATIFQGVQQHLALWKTAMTVFIVLLAVLVCLLIAAPK